jgi:hypothetical protein
MAKNGTITMSMREIDRLMLIQAIVDGNLKPMRAAERLQMTTRQIRRLVSRYRIEGAAGAIRAAPCVPLMIVCPLHLHVVEREAIVPGTADDENNAADLPVTMWRCCAPSVQWEVSINGHSSSKNTKRYGTSCWSWVPCQTMSRLFTMRVLQGDL